MTLLQPIEPFDEWFSIDSIMYVVECLETCENAEMVQDLRQTFPGEVLREASRRVNQLQRHRLKKWLQELNHPTLAFAPSQIIQIADQRHPCKGMKLKIVATKAQYLLCQPINGKYKGETWYLTLDEVNNDVNSSYLQES
ncbi:hypothetical protein [Chlorogloeopsis sp. ULAP02]|uniref:hypothetical protein n=1 Tax=Chlorogloeopsis sp. ULAP02 TaxID=3107926 RepID=UPI003136DA7B